MTRGECWRRKDIGRREKQDTSGRRIVEEEEE
jgi:hypothetical protein